MHKYMTNLVDKRISKPGDPRNDLISKLVVEQYKPGNIDRDDIQSLAYLVLVAGNAAVINSIALGVLTLLQHPEQLDQLKKDPQLASLVTEEVLRYHTPSSLNSRRVATEDTDIGGKVRSRLPSPSPSPSPSLDTDCAKEHQSRRGCYWRRTGW